MALDERTSRPLYRQVADELRGQIRNRELTPGGQLPTESDLMDRYGVSRNTVRLALGVLRTEGLVVTGQGRGSFVADLSTPATSRGARSLSRRGVVHVSDALDDELTGAADDTVTDGVTTRPASVVMADRLGLEAGGHVIVRHRLRMAEHQPSHSTDTYVPERLAEGTALADPAPLRAGIAEQLAELGHPVSRLSDEIGVRMPTPAEAQELQIATGVPVLTVLRTAFDPDDRAVVAVTALLPGDRHVLRYDAAVSLVDNELTDGA